MDHSFSDGGVWGMAGAGTDGSAVLGRLGTIPSMPSTICESAGFGACERTSINSGSALGSKLRLADMGTTVEKSCDKMGRIHPGSLHTSRIHAPVTP